MKFDMHALGGMTVEWSDDEGASWTGPSIATGYSVQDHQTIASSPYGGLLHETLWVFCINGNAPMPLCAASQDGGFTWGPELPGGLLTACPPQVIVLNGHPGASEQQGRQQAVSKRPGYKGRCRSEGSLATWRARACQEATSTRARDTGHRSHQECRLRTTDPVGTATPLRPTTHFSHSTGTDNNCP